MKKADKTETLIREFVVNQLISEYLGWREPKTKTTTTTTTSSDKKGFLHRAKSFFSGHSRAEQIVYDWFEDQDLRYDVEFPEESKKAAAERISKKYKEILKKNRGDKEATEASIKDSLQLKFGRAYRQRATEAGPFDDIDDKALNIAPEKKTQKPTKKSRSHYYDDEGEA